MGTVAGNAFAKAFGPIVVTGMGAVSGAGILLESASLLGMSAADDWHTSDGKIAKVVLGVIAVIGALFVTVGFGFLGSLLTASYLPSLEVALLGGLATSVATLAIHWKTFEWFGQLPSCG